MGVQARLRKNRDFETIISQKHRIMVNSHVQLFNSRGYERLCTKSHFRFRLRLRRPDVRRGWAPPVNSNLVIWAMRLVRALPSILSPEAEPGAQPKPFYLGFRQGRTL